MLGLKIDNLNISVDTNGGLFECSIPFQNGLNIIRAENSSGKSTCVNAIAYGLGLEAILGPIRKRPFPKSMYEEIFDTKKDQNPFFVNRSQVRLEIRNSTGKRARLTRDILGNDKKVSVEIDGKNEDYFLGASGQVGSAVSERGFHYWLADYMGWALPNVVTFNGSETKLYLECIFPLFFIEQKRGWSEIQANIPTHYGIRNVKRLAAEFCLDIDSFDFERKVISYKNRIDEAKLEWSKLISAAQAAAEFNTVDLPPLPEIEKENAANNIEFFYLEGEAKITVSEKRRSLVKLLERLQSDEAAAAPHNEKMDQQNAVVRSLQRDYEEISGFHEVAIVSVGETESKLATLKSDLDQYQQLRRLKKVGSDLDLDLEYEKCPICESSLYDTLGSRSVERQPMTLEENIEFLKSQIGFFETVHNRALNKIEVYRSRIKFLQSRLRMESKKLKDIREDIEDVNGVIKSLLREKIVAEIELRDVDKLKIIQDELRARASKVQANWRTNTEGLKLLRKNSNIDNNKAVIRKLQSILRLNLEAFQFNPSAINSITISPQTLRPEQEGYDIVAETSASDYIRIIWAYTLALMELAADEENLKHGGFVVFDEPRQHEASKLSFANLISKASDSKYFDGQVIFATSLDDKELSIACKNKDVNLVSFSDYILTSAQE